MSLAEGVVVLMGTFFPYQVTLVRSLAAGKALFPQLALCASHSPSVPGGVLESLEYVGPLLAMLFCHLPHFTFPHVDRGKSSGSFQMTFGSTGFQQCGVAVSYTSLSPASLVNVLLCPANFKGALITYPPFTCSEMRNRLGRRPPLCREGKG